MVVAGSKFPGLNQPFFPFDVARYRSVDGQYYLGWVSWGLAWVIGTIPSLPSGTSFSYNYATTPELTTSWKELSNKALVLNPLMSVRRLSTHASRVRSPFR